MSVAKTGALALGFATGSLATVLMLAWWKRKTEKEDEEYEARRLKRKLLSTASHDALENNNNTTRSLSSIGPTSSFLTDIMRELWTYINVAGGDTIRASVEPYFELYLPSALKTLHFTKVDLGTNPIKMDNLFVRTIKNGMVCIEMDIIWNGNGDIQLRTEPPGGIGRISFGVQNIKLCGQFCLWLKPLANELPVVSGIQYAFLNPPHIDLKFTGLAAVADFVVIEKAVRDAIQASLLSLVLPNRGAYKMMATNNYLDTYQPPVGVVCVTAVKGRGFVIERKTFAKDDVPDVYLNVTLGTSPVWRTQTIPNNLSPEWNEGKDFLLHDRAQKISIHAWDEDKHPLDPDDDLGTASALVSEILLQPKRELEVELEVGEKKMDAFVTLQCDILPWTTDLSSLDITEPNEHQIDGLLVIIVNRGFNVPVEREKVCSFVKVVFGDQEFQTGQVSDYEGVDALNPMYEIAFEFPLVAGMVTSGNGAKVALHLINLGAVSGKEQPLEQVLGTLYVSLDDLRAAHDHTITEKKPIGEGGAAIEYRASLSGVKRKPSLTKGGKSSSGIRSSINQEDDSKQDPHEPGATRPQVIPKAASERSARFSLTERSSALSLRKDENPGFDESTKVRLTIEKGVGFQISQELFSIDVPDAYCKVKVGASDEVWQTSYKKDTCKPVWNESKLFDFVDHSQIISMEVWDKNSRAFDPDTLHGIAKTTVGKVLLAGGSMDLPLTRKGRPTGITITIKCELDEHD